MQYGTDQKQLIFHIVYGNMKKTCKGEAPMEKRLERSDRREHHLTLLPQHLLCLFCYQGGGCAPFMETHDFAGLVEKLRQNPDIHITLTAAYDEIGARTDLYYEQTPEERKRDLDMFRLLGLVPGDTRTARELIERIKTNIPEIGPVCTYDFPGWEECPLARNGYFEKGREVGLLPPDRTDRELSDCKHASCQQIAKAHVLSVRAHHLLCMTCFLGRGNTGPIEEDNLFEIWDKIRQNPEIPIRLVEGAEECMVCPPCWGYLPDRGLCIRACHLRDRKKDLETFCRLGLQPNDILPAKEILARIYTNIPHTKGICSFEKELVPEWANCSGSYGTEYEKGLQYIHATLSGKEACDKE
jgi:hypothetical protein